MALRPLRLCESCLYISVGGQNISVGGQKNDAPTKDAPTMKKNKREGMPNQNILVG